MTAATLIREGIEPAWESDAGPGRWRVAAWIALLVCCIHLALIVRIDNTNLGTTNGLWKSADVAKWEHVGRGPVDSGGFLYLPVYGILSRLIPDSWLRYGTAPRDVTFRKMAVWNGIFGAISSGFVWVFATRLTRHRAAAALVVLAHAGAAFVLLNSLNSEDIVSAYAFFVAATTLLFEFLASGRIVPGIASAVALAFATLFHWTVMAPALAGYGAVFALLALQDRRFLVIGAGWLFAFLCAAQALVLIAFPALHIPIWAVVLPAKASAAGWTGLRAEKLLLLVVGVGSYFSGGANVSDYHVVFAGPLRYSVTASWAFVLAAAAASVAVLLRRGEGQEAKCVAVFAIVLFLAGQAGNLYSQPQDPQMQLPPMFSATAGFALLVCRLGPRRLLSWGLSVLLSANALWNVRLMSAAAGFDGRSIAEVLEFERLFPRQTTATVCQGFEGWTTWQFALFWSDDRKGRLDRTLELTSPFVTVGDISGAQAADLMSARIDGAQAAGMRTVAVALWTESPDRFIGSLGTVTSLKEAAEYDRILRARYHGGQRWHTQLGDVVELVRSR